MAIVCDFLLEQLNKYSNQLQPEYLSMALLGLARLGIRFSKASEISFLFSLVHSLPNMDDQQVTNSLWAIGKIGVLWETLSLPIRKAIIKSVVRTSSKLMTPQGISNTIHGLSNTRVRWDALPRHLRDALTCGLLRTIRDMKEQVDLSLIL